MTCASVPVKARTEPAFTEFSPEHIGKDRHREKAVKEPGLSPGKAGGKALKDHGLCRFLPQGEQIRNKGSKVLHAHDQIFAVCSFHGEVIPQMDFADFFLEQKGKEFTNVLKIGPRQNRVGDHIWWISSVQKFKNHFPDWDFKYNLEKILLEIYELNKDRWK